MLVRDSELLHDALDRRLQVDRLLPVDPSRPVADAQARSAPPTAPARAPGPTGPLPVPPRLPDRLPLGQVVGARVVEVAGPERVIAEIGTLRVALAWPAGSGNVPQPGSEVGLRVLAHRPVLLFQRIASAEGAPTTADGAESPVRWSADAVHLQAATADPRSAQAAGVVRFDEPILSVESGRDGATMDGERAGRAAPPGASATPVPGTSIALDDVIVGREAPAVDTVAASGVPAFPEEHRADAFVPLVLQGPAWDGQPVEIVVRRERADAQFDNAALDRWCGELLIDLPQLGRIAGHLTWSMQGLRIRLEGDDEAAIDAMDRGSAALATALAQVDLRVCALSVGGPAADGRRTTDAHPPSSAAVSFARLPS